MEHTMTYKDEFTLSFGVRGQIAAQGLDFPLRQISFLVNTAMQVEHWYQAFAARICSDRLFQNR